MPTWLEIGAQKSYRYTTTFEGSFINKLVAIKTDIPIKSNDDLVPFSIIRLSYLLRQNLGKKTIYKYILVCRHGQIATAS